MVTRKENQLPEPYPLWKANKSNYGPVSSVTSVLNGLPGVQIADGVGQPGMEAEARYPRIQFGERQ